MFELFCNKCFEQRHFNPGLDLHASRCGHILCSACVMEKCPVCSNPFKSVPIDNNMPASMADYFSSPIEKYQHLEKIIKFQKHQETLLISHMYNTQEEHKVKAKKEFDGYKKIYDKLQPEIQHEEERIRKMKDYISYHERRMEHSKYMTPPITAHARLRYPVPSQQSYASSIDGKSSNTVTASQLLKPKIQGPRTPTLSHSSTDSLTSANKHKFNSDNQPGPSKHSQQRQLSPGKQLQQLNYHKLADSSFSSGSGPTSKFPELKRKKNKVPPSMLSFSNLR